MTSALLTARADLDERLGGDSRALRNELLRSAHAWAATVTPGRPVRLVAPEEIVDAARQAFAVAGGPLLVAAVETPRLSAEHARMALGDLEHGADVSFGPGLDGGCYLVALARPHPTLLELLDEAIDGTDVMTRAFGAAQAGDLKIGLLRMERMLRTPRDLAAMRVDPLTPQGVRTALRRMG